ncbi:MAG: glycosyltransferase family 2 protein [Alphaproteobacteria bacterium]|nr:glycosyltransferase family 2 protein [Alphaproteobacteria bacterium]MCB9797504.1 glycosyltransferase family 2 protein [Alphaproteobacteria bacterium]
MSPAAALIPARDEGPRVGAVVRGVRQHVSRVLVVVNGSSDDTAARAEEAGAEVIFSAPGYARALAAGYRALAGGGPVIQLDADGQHPPDAAPALLEALGEADLVIGSRFLGEAGYVVPRARSLGIRALSAWTWTLTGLRVRDVTSGLQALSPAAVALFAQGFPEQLADANVLIWAWRQGLVIHELPVAMRVREGGASMHAGAPAVGYAARVALAGLLERLSP